MPIILSGDGDRYLARLERMGSPLLTSAVGKSLIESAEAIRSDAVASLDEGAILGPGHVPSEPGQPPNSDTRALAESGAITELTEAEVGEDHKLSIAVTFGNDDVIYAGMQEYGTSNLPERPFLHPASERGRQPTADGVRDAVRKVITGA